MDFSFLIFESANVHSILQIDLKWKTWYIPSLNKTHNNRTSIGWVLLPVYSCDTFERLRNLNVSLKSLLLALFFPYFKLISIEKIAIFRLGISTIQIPTHLVNYYQYFTRVTHSKVWRNVHLFWMFESDIVTFVIQIDFKWQTFYIPHRNKDHINRNSIGWELITISSYDIFELWESESFVFKAWFLDCNFHT
jgi:hypothetical protein